MASPPDPPRPSPSQRTATASKFWLKTASAPVSGGEDEPRRSRTIPRGFPLAPRLPRLQQELAEFPTANVAEDAPRATVPQGTPAAQTPKATA